MPGRMPVIAPARIPRRKKKINSSIL